MRIKVILIPLLLSVAAFLAPVSWAGDEIYRWVDEDGVVHFGDNAEGNPDAELVEVRGTTGINASPPPPAGAVSPAETPQPEVSPAQQKRDERAERRKEAAERQQQVAATCKVARERVATFEPSTRVIVRDEDGTVSRMDDEQRLSLLEEAKAYIAENCSE